MIRVLIIAVLFLVSCNFEKPKQPDKPYVIVLGVTQDAGYPQMNCKKQCCEPAWENSSLRKTPACLAIVDPISKEQWILDATPNIKDQLQLLKLSTGTNKIDGVLLTHAHIGHYTGLMHFGREAMGSQKTPVFTMPRMKSFLEKNGPWSQLIKLENIILNKIISDSTFNLNKRIQITPFLVPHRDEFSETVGYNITINEATLLFIPDIDKWGEWETDIIKLIEQVDYAFLDATFYKNGELKRDMSEIPHPFVEESMQLLSELSNRDKQKVYFIHFNHTNPLLIENSTAQKEVQKEGFNLAKEGQIIEF